MRKDVARERLLGVLRETLTGPKEVAFIRKTVAEVLGNLARKSKAEVEEHRARLGRTEERIAGLIQFIADGDRSEYVRAALHDLEAQAKVDKRAIAELEARATTAIRLPSPEETVQRALNFEKNLLANPVAGREELRRLFADGKVLCRPHVDGYYVAEGKILPLAIFSMRLAEPAQEAPLSAAPGARGKTACSINGCAGRI